ncbi:MAG TPA: hypothetical protein VLG50_02915 [Candidatus Saccharimonadales bacterium]|nr:hypothetical protein [Candidatus Saccharimonadales bacterium]
MLSTKSSMVLTCCFLITGAALLASQKDKPESVQETKENVTAIYQHAIITYMR